MKKIVNNCCGCAVPGYPCAGASCPNRKVEEYICDACGEYIEGDLYGDGSEDLCEECLLARYKKEA